MKKIPFFVAAAISFSSAGAQAQDASFGCKVLLCAASTTGWEGIPYCVPVMNQLFEMLSKGEAWPSCPEGGTTSGINHEPFESCPEGAIAGKIEGDNFATNPNGGFCGTRKGMVASGLSGRDIMGTDNVRYSVLERARRAKPYYVIVQPTGGTPVHVWFSLNSGQ